MLLADVWEVRGDDSTHVSENLDSVMGLVDAAALQEFADSDWVLWGRRETAHVYPVLDSVEVDGCVGFFIAGGR